MARKVPSPWFVAIIPSGSNTSNEVALEEAYEKAIFIVPDLTTDTSVVVNVSDVSGGNFYPLNITAPPKQKATVADIGGVQFVKITCTTNQGAARAILIRGI